MLNEYAVLALMCHKCLCSNYAQLVLYCTIFSSAYTEPFPMNSISAALSADEDHGRTSEEEEGAGEPSCDRQVRYRTQAQMEGRRKVVNYILGGTMQSCKSTDQARRCYFSGLSGGMSLRHE